MSLFTVRRGQRYRATITLGVIEQFADNEMIAGRLAEAGFTDVQVSGEGGTRVAEALWPNDDTEAPLPPQVTEIAEVA
jgi:hypothetical protein